MSKIAMSAHLLLEHGLTILLQSSLVLALGLLIGWRWRQQGPTFVSFVSRLTLLSVTVLSLCAVIFHPSPAALFSVHLPPVSNPPAVVAPQALPPVPAPSTPILNTPIWVKIHPVRSHIASKALPKTLAFVPLAHAITPKQILPPASPTRHSSLPASAWVEISLVMLWLAGTLGLLLRLVLGQVFLWRISRRASPAPLDVQRMLSDLCREHRIFPPRVRISAQVHSPFLAGSLRPVVYLPGTSLDPQTVRAVLMHELTHRIRHDCAWQFAGQIVGALLWPQPLLWLLFQRAEQASEEVCDLSVVSQDCTPAAYAALLLDLSERFNPGQTRRALGTGIVPHQSALSRRIQTILDRRFTTMTLAPKTRLGLTAVLTAAALSSLFLVSTHAASPIHFSIFSTQKQMAEKSMNNMHQMILGVQQYAQDYDDQYPPARKWGTVIAPYLRPKDVAVFSPIEHSKDLHHDPLAPETQAYGYAFNQGLGSKGTRRLLSPSTTVALFETTQDNFNATDTGRSLARPGRLNGGNYYAFADGHVQWVSDSLAPSFKPSLSPHSIRPRPSNIAVQSDQGDTDKQARLQAEIAQQQAIAAAQTALAKARAELDTAKATQTQGQADAEKEEALAAAQKALTELDIQRLTEKSQLNQKQLDLLQASKNQALAALHERMAAMPLAKLDASNDLRLQDLQGRIATLSANDLLQGAQRQQLADEINALQAQEDTAPLSLQPLSADQIKQFQALQDGFKDSQHGTGKHDDATRKQWDAMLKQYGSGDTFSWKKLDGQDGTKKNYDALMKQYYGADVFSGKWPSGQEGTKKDYDALMKQLAASGTSPLKLQYAPLAGLRQQQGDLKNQLVAAQKHQANLSEIIAQLSITNQMIQSLQEQLLQEQKELEKLQEKQPANSTTDSKPSPIDYSLRALQEQTKNLQQEQTQAILQEQKELEKLRQVANKR